MRTITLGVEGERELPVLSNIGDVNDNALSYHHQRRANLGDDHSTGNPLR